MKMISVCGKGGSGKSTVTALLADGIQGRVYGVLVVDSDESSPRSIECLAWKGDPRLSPSVLTQEEIPVDDIPHPYIEEGDAHDTWPHGVRYGRRSPSPTTDVSHPGGRVITFLHRIEPLPVAA
jgi:hypothetical protein